MVSPGDTGFQSHFLLSGLKVPNVDSGLVSGPYSTPGTRTWWLNVFSSLEGTLDHSTSSDKAGETFRELVLSKSQFNRVGGGKEKGRMEEEEEKWGRDPRWGKVWKGRTGRELQRNFPESPWLGRHGLSHRLPCSPVVGLRRWSSCEPLTGEYVLSSADLSINLQGFTLILSTLRGELLFRHLSY